MITSFIHPEWSKQFIHKFGVVILSIGLFTSGQALAQEYDIVVQTGHGFSDAIQTLKYSPDKKQLASAGRDGKVILWDVLSGRKLREVVGEETNISAIDFSADGKKLVIFPEDEKGRVWNTETGTLDTLTTRIGGGLQPWSGVMMDEKRRVILVAETEWYEFNSTTGKLQRTAGNYGTDDGFRRAAFLPEKGFVTATHNNGQVTVWSYPELKQIKSLKKNKKWQGCLQFSPSGKYLAVAGELVRIYDINAGFKLLHEFEPLLEEQWDVTVEQVTFVSDERIILSNRLHSDQFPSTEYHSLILDIESYR